MFYLAGVCEPHINEARTNLIPPNRSSREVVYNMLPAGSPNIIRSRASAYGYDYQSQHPAWSRSARIGAAVWSRREMDTLLLIGRTKHKQTTRTKDVRPAETSTTNKNELFIGDRMVTGQRPQCALHRILHFRHSKPLS